MLTWARSISDGSASLSHHLTVAIFDYQRAFGKEPRLILVPYWRDNEIDERLLVFKKGINGHATFRGIRFRFSIIQDFIELKASE